nr:hypothetical protein [Tanacetum cinerariifolium]
MKSIITGKTLAMILLLLVLTNPNPPQSSVIHQPPQELSIQEIEDLKQQYLDELQRLSNLEYRDEIKIAELKENFNACVLKFEKRKSFCKRRSGLILALILPIVYILSALMMMMMRIILLQSHLMNPFYPPRSLITL